MTVGVIPFSILAAVAVLAALAMLVSRNAIHAALFLTINFSAIAILFLALNAPFLAVAQLVVYVGAIMPSFLFVMMLLGVDKLSGQNELEWQLPAAALLTVVLLLEGGYLLLKHMRSEPGLTKALADNSPQAVGELLFDSFLLPFEIIAVLLLVAMIGVVALTLDEEEQDE